MNWGRQEFIRRRMGCVVVRTVRPVQKKEEPQRTQRSAEAGFVSNGHLRLVLGPLSKNKKIDACTARSAPQLAVMPPRPSLRPLRFCLPLFFFDVHAAFGNLALAEASPTCPYPQTPESPS